MDSDISGIYKIFMVSMFLKKLTNTRNKGMYKIEISMLLRFSKKCCYERPQYVIGIFKITIPECRPKNICKDMIIGTRKGNKLIIYIIRLRRRI